MEWQTVLGSALGSSPVAAVSFYWARAAWKARENREEQHQKDLQAKDEIIAKKDAQIAALQESRLADLRAVMRVTPEPARMPPRQSG